MLEKIHDLDRFKHWVRSDKVKLSRDKYKVLQLCLKSEFHKYKIEEIA